MYLCSAFTICSPALTSATTQIHSPTFRCWGSLAFTEPHPYLDKCRINFFFPGFCFSSVKLVPARASRLWSAWPPWWFLPYQVHWESNVSAVREHASLPEDEYQILSASPRRLLLTFTFSHVPMAALPMCLNKNCYTQINFRRLNHAENTPLSFFLYWLCVKYKPLLDVFTFYD